MRLLAADPATGATTVLREDTDPRWLEIVPGVPARTGGPAASGSSGSRTPTGPGGCWSPRLASWPARPAAVTPAGLQVREVLGVDGDTVLFTASDGRPAAIDVWLYAPAVRRRPARGSEVISPPGRVRGHPVRRHHRDHQPTRPAWPGRSVRAVKTHGACAARRPARLAEIACWPRRRRAGPRQPDPAGAREIRAAVLLPSGYARRRPLPVLMDPYGGPHAQRVLAARGAFVASQWLADQGFAVIVADGRGTPGRGPAWDRAIRARPGRAVLEDQVDGAAGGGRAVPATWISPGRASAAGRSAVTSRRWRCCGAPTCSTPRSRARRSPTGGCTTPTTPSATSATRTRTRSRTTPSFALARTRPGWTAPAAAHPRPGRRQRGRRAHAAAVLGAARRGPAAQRAAAVGVTHMTPQEVVAENLMLLQVDFLREALGMNRTGVTGRRGVARVTRSERRHPAQW